MLLTDEEVRVRIASGDLLGTLGKKYGASIHDIAAVNKLRNRHKIKVGNKYLYEARFQFFNKKDANIACKRLKKYNRDCFIRG